MLPVRDTISFPGLVETTTPAQPESRFPIYKKEWKDDDVTHWETEGYQPDNTAVGDKCNYFNYIESRWADNMWLKTSVLSHARVHYKTGLLEISHPRNEKEVKGFYLSVTLPGEREPIAQLYIDTCDKEIAKNIHLEFVSIYRRYLDASRLMKFGFEPLCHSIKEEAVNNTLIWLKAQHSELITRFDNKQRKSPNRGTALARNILSQMARDIFSAMNEASEKRMGHL